MGFFDLRLPAPPHGRQIVGERERGMITSVTFHITPNLTHAPPSIRTYIESAWEYVKETNKKPKTSEEKARCSGEK